MNVLFLSSVYFGDILQHNIYHDLLRLLMKKGHSVYVVSSSEGKVIAATPAESTNCHIVYAPTFQLQKNGLIHKGVAMLMLRHQFITTIKKHYQKVAFDLVLFVAPPITMSGVVNYIKRQYGAKSFLMLKDIFPQNAVDLKVFAKHSPFYYFFRRQEHRLYESADYIGCMSPANQQYICEHNPELNGNKTMVFPNAFEVTPCLNTQDRSLLKTEFCSQHNIPTEARLFVYGGNLGRPQDIPFIIQCLRQNANKPDRYFVICGTGTEYPKLEQYIQAERPNNVLLLNGLPGEAYHKLCAACDVGLIFLDHRFTIPNFPSRLLSYMELNMPVLACTDTNTDMGQIICDNEFGWWCESNDATGFTKMVDSIVEVPLEQIAQKGQCARTYLEENYTVEKCYEIIMKSIEGER